MSNQAMATGAPAPIPQRNLQVGNETFVLYDLGPRMDAGYDALYSQALPRPAIQWPDFWTAVEDFVRSKPAPDAMDRFFANATPIWTRLMAAGRYEGAAEYLERILDAVTRAERAAATTVHKGSGYFFWGCNALERGDDEQGLLFMHQAVLEDARLYKTPWPSTAAVYVVTLNAQRFSGHPANWWVANQVGAIDHALDGVGARLKLADIRARLFLNTDAASMSLFVLAHASLLRLAQLPAEHRDSGFVGRLALGHLFHMAVVIENAIAAKSGKTGLFKAQVEVLSTKLGGRLAEKYLGDKTRAGEINDQQNADADATLRSLLAATATYGGMAVAPVDRDLCVAYVLRNLGGHEPGAPRVISEDLDAFRQIMLGVLAACTDAYY